MKVSGALVPTTFATDAMSISVAAIWQGNHMNIVSGPPLQAVIVDSNIIKNAPWRFQAAGFADYLSKVCALSDWDLACAREKDHVYNEYAIACARALCGWLMKNVDAVRRKEERAFEAFLQILMTDGYLIEMAGNVRVVSGSEHIVTEALGEQYVPGRQKPLHGELVGLSSILMACWQEQDWMAVREALEKIGAPVTAKQIGYDDEAVVSALVKSKEVNFRWIEEMPRYHTILLEKALTKESAIGLAKRTEII